MSDTVKRTERGWGGHFILGERCLFRRNTLLEYGDRKWIVSTVGSLLTDGEIDTIGANRWYETMVFEAVLENGYLDADVSKQIDVSQDWGIWGNSWDEVLKEHPYPDNGANNMHERIVEEMTEKIKGDELWTK